MREPLQNHFQTCAHLYEIDRAITKIDVRPVVNNYERVVDYVFKTIKRGRVSYDEGMLILPRTRDELTSLCDFISRSATDKFRLDGTACFYRVKGNGRLLFCQSRYEDRFACVSDLIENPGPDLSDAILRARIPALSPPEGTPSQVRLTLFEH